MRNYLTGISTHIPLRELSEIEAKMNSTFDMIFSFIRNIVTPIAIVCFAICGIMMMISSDAQSVRTARQWMLRIGGGLFVVYAARLIVDTIVAIVA